jgi:hypothetical protein
MKSDCNTSFQIHPREQSVSASAQNRLCADAVPIGQLIPKKSYLPIGLQTMASGIELELDSSRFGTNKLTGKCRLTLLSPRR